jgi:hypothetical protein
MVVDYKKIIIEAVWKYTCIIRLLVAAVNVFNIDHRGQCDENFYGCNTVVSALMHTSMPLTLLQKSHTPVNEL